MYCAVIQFLDKDVTGDPLICGIFNSCSKASARIEMLLEDCYNKTDGWSKEFFQRGVISKVFYDEGQPVAKAYIYNENY